MKSINFYRFNLYLIICFLGFVFVNSNLILLIKLNTHISFEVIFYISLLGSIFYAYKKSPISIKECKWSLFIYLIFFLIAYFSFDKGGDGRWYHQGILSQLYDGWNPFYDYSKELFLQVKDDPRYYYNYIIYPLGNELLALPFVIIFHSVQVGKIINFLWLFALYLSLKLYLSKFKLDSKSINYVITVWLVSPYVLTMTLSYYLDANIFIGICIFLILVLWIINNDNSFFTNIELYVFSSLVYFYIISLKPTVIVFLLFCLFTLLLIYKRNCFKLSKLWLLSLMTFSVIALYHPYIQNYLIGIPVLDTAGWKLDSWNLIFMGMRVTNSFEAFFISLLPLPMSNDHIHYFFDIRKYAGAIDAGVGAYGPFFGIYLIIAVVYFVKNRVNLHKDILFWFFSAIISSIGILIISYKAMILLRWVILLYMLIVSAYWLYCIKSNNQKRKLIVLYCILFNFIPIFVIPNMITIYRSYSYLLMQSKCHKEQCIADIVDNTGNWFYVSLRWQLRMDNPTIRFASCKNKTIVWRDAKISGEDYNMVCYE